MYSYVTRIYPFVLVCYPYVTRVYPYVTRMYPYVSYVTHMLPILLLLVVLVWSISQDLKLSTLSSILFRLKFTVFD